jgi:hypothetical protein
MVDVLLPRCLQEPYANTLGFAVEAETSMGSLFSIHHSVLSERDLWW